MVRELAARRLLAVVVALLGLVSGLSLGAAQAGAPFVLEQAYPQSQPLGPDRALGVVIWSHGKPPYKGSEGDMLPFYLDWLRDAGWDVLRLERDWYSDNLALSPAALRVKVDELYQQGYRKIVLAGQSYGAWISLIVAASGPPIHAVIATAPAAFGRFPDSKIFHRNADDLYPILENIRDTRVMMFLFDGDAYDTGDRGAPTEEILGAHGVPRAVIAYPKGWTGHGAANWNGFATRFGPCMVHFVDPAAQAGDTKCERNPVTRDAVRLQLPDSPAAAGSADAVRLTPVSAKRTAPPAANPFAGLWYGVYPNGREAALRFESVTPGVVSAVYAWGIQKRDEEGAPGYDRRVGRLEGDRIVFAEPDRPTLDARPLGPDRMQLTWTSRDGQRTVSTELHRLN